MNENLVKPGNTRNNIDIFYKYSREYFGFIEIYSPCSKSENFLSYNLPHKHAQLPLQNTFLVRCSKHVINVDICLIP